MNPDETINWLYIISALGIRFVGVFMILGILQIAISVSSKITSRFIANK